MAKLEDKIVQAIVETLNVSEVQVTLQTRIKEDLGADSMDIVTLMVVLDDMFDAEFDPAEIPSEQVTVEWIVEYIKHIISEKD